VEMMRTLNEMHNVYVHELVFHYNWGSVYIAARVAAQNFSLTANDSKQTLVLS
jgi:hypothetical protein